MVESEEQDCLPAERDSIVSSLLCDSASVPQAEKHRKATSVRRLSTSSNRCVCCLLPYDSSPFSLCCKIDDLAELGAAFPLLFYLSWYLGGMLLFVMVIASLPNLAENLYANRNYDFDSNSWVAATAIVSYKPHDYERFRWQVALNTIALFVICVFYMLVTWHAKAVSKRLETNKFSPSNFAIMVENLGLQWSPEDIKAKIIESVELKGKGKVEILSLDVSYHMEEYLTFKKQFRDRVVDTVMLQRGLVSREQCCRCMRCCCCKARRNLCLDKTLDSVLQAVLNYEQEGKGSKTGIAFVTFATVNQAKLAFRALRPNPLQDVLFALDMCGKLPTINERKVRVSRAHEPSDIKWRNLRFSRSSQQLRQLVTWSLLSLILAASFFMLYGLAQWQNSMAKTLKSAKDDNLYHLDYSPIPAAGIIMVVNLLLEVTVRVMAKLERHQTYTDESISIARKLAISLSLNTLLFQPFVNITSDEGYNSSLLASNIFWVSVATAFSRTLLRIFDPRIAWKCLRQWSIRRAINSKKVFVPQFAANAAFQRVELDAADCYADLVVRFLLALAFTPLLPVIVPVTLVGYACNHWANKWLLLRVSCRPRQMNKRIMQDMISFVKIGLIFYAISIYFFYSDVNSDTEPYGIAALVIAGSFSLLHLVVFSCCWRSTHSALPQDINYNEDTFPCVLVTQTYASENPVTQIEARAKRLLKGINQPTGLWHLTSKMTNEKLVKSVKSFSMERNRQNEDDDDDVERDENANLDSIVLEAEERPNSE